MGEHNVGSAFTLSHCQRSLSAHSLRSLLQHRHLESELTSYYLTFSAGHSLPLVDRRLSGDGTGKALGINDPVLGFIILFTLAAVRSLFSSSSKNMGGQRDEDGLGL